MKTPLLSLVAACAIPSMLDAAVLVTLNPDAPQADLIAAQTQKADNGWAWRNTQGGATPSFRHVGHSFKATSATSLKSIHLFLWSYSADAPGAAFTLRIFETEGVADNPVNHEVRVETGNLPTLLGSGEYLVFELEDSLDLEADKYYTFILSFDSPSSNRSLNFGAASASGFDGFRWYEDLENGAYTRRNDSTRLEFYIQADAIPEPGSAAFLTMGALGILGTFVCKAYRKRSE